MSGTKQAGAAVGRARIRRLLWINATLAIAGITAAIATSRSRDWESAELILILMSFAIASEVLSYGTRHEWAVSSSAPYVLAITLLGPAPAAAIALVAVGAAGFIERSRVEDVVANFANYLAFTVAGGLFCRSIVDGFDLTPSEPEFGLLILGTYAFVMVASQSLALAYDHLTGPTRPVRLAILGQAIAECLAAVVTAGAVLVYGEVGLWGLSALAVVQLTYSYLFFELARSTKREQALERNRAERGKLVEEVSAARELERARLASALHDESLQNLYALRQDVTALPDPESRARAHAAVDRTIAQLRGEILDLNPAVLASAGLAEGVRALATAVSRRAGFRTELAVDVRAGGIHDRLLLELVREQLINAAKHAEPRTVRISIVRAHEVITMEVADDGAGISEGRLQEAISQGHVGLAASEERVIALGGSLSVRGEPQAGTRITTTLPVDAVAP